MAPTDRPDRAGDLPVVSILLIGLGGFVGAVARHLLDSRISALTQAAFPWGTMVINVSGSFLIGVLFSLLIERATLPVELRGPLMIGFLGAFTTFSTLALDSWRLIADGALLHATGNLVGSVVLGLLAVIGGITLGRAL